MSPSPDPHSSGAAGDPFGFTTGQAVQELGYDDDVDMDLRDTIEDSIDDDMLDEDAQEIVDGVILWWRDGDGDLTDALVDSLTTLAEGGPVWLLTPKPGREGHVLPAAVQEAANTAGMRAMNTMSVAPDWSGTRLSPRQG